jgi:hypothetical protein
MMLVLVSWQTYVTDGALRRDPISFGLLHVETDNISSPAVCA